jgi:CheY-like chemotaxis protein
MGGSIRVESEVGRGSAFTFSILTEPAPLPVDIDYVPPLPAALRSGWVLCLEDNPVVRSRLEQFFKKWGTACEVADDDTSLMDVMARRSVPPCLVVADHGGGGGVISGAAAKFTCPYLATVLFGREGPAAPPQRRFGIITKPLKTAALQQAIGRLFADGAAAGAAAPSIEPRLADEIPLRVLLAEDNLVNQKVAQGLLQRLGYQPDLAANGLEVLERLAAQTYDLVLMDLQMPEMDGLEACGELRRRLPPARQPRVIALTANAMQGDRDRCLAAGMNDYISKPVKLHEIAAVIRRQFLRTAGQRRAEVGGA